MVTLRGQALTIPYRLIGADRMPAAPSSRGAGVNRSYRPTENADLRWMDSTFIANERVTALLQPVARRCSIRRRSTLLAAIQTLIMTFRHPRCKRSVRRKESLLPLEARIADYRTPLARLVIDGFAELRGRAAARRRSPAAVPRRKWAICHVCSGGRPARPTVAAASLRMIPRT